MKANTGDSEVLNRSVYIRIHIYIYNTYAVLRDAHTYILCGVILITPAYSCTHRCQQQQQPLSEEQCWDAGLRMALELGHIHMQRVLEAKLNIKHLKAKQSFVV